MRALSYCKARLERKKKTGGVGTVVLLTVGGVFAALGLLLASAILIGQQGDKATVALAAIMAAVLLLLPGAALLALGIGKLRSRRRDSDPEQSVLVRAVRRQLPAEQAELPLDQILDIVDRDLSGGRTFGKDMVIGQEWVLAGDLAVPVRRIRGVFLQSSAHRTQYTYISGHMVNVFDDARVCGTVGFLANGELAVECYKALCTAAPWAMRGGLKEQGELAGLSPERLRAWNEELERQ